MKCLNCDNERQGRRQYCSDKCKVAYNRNKNRNAPVTIEPDSVTISEIVTPEECLVITKPTSTEFKQVLADEAHEFDGLQHYRDNPASYAPRANADRLNWGAWMNADQLHTARLTANRVSIPGDWDYDGVCRQIDGEWRAA